MQSLWQATEKLPHFPSLDGDKKTEVLIIGGGIAGILTAYYLHQAEVPYILVEKGEIGQGTTGCTTAKITMQHGLIYGKLLKHYDIETVRMYYKANVLAMEEYEKLCQTIDCDYEKKDSYLYATKRYKRLQEECEALHLIGQKASLTDWLTLPIGTEGALMCPNQAQFHPLRFLASIAKDLHIYEHTWVREMVGTNAVTDSGCIEANKVVVATHFPFLNTHGSYFLKLYQHRSYVLALQDAGDVHGMYRDMDSNGLSFRNYGDYLLLSGGSHRTGKQGGFEQLRQFAAKQYPDAKIKYVWAAQDCMSLDGVPYIGNYSTRTKHIYVASGFNKWGMTGAMVSAMLLSDLILGRKNQCLPVFSPSRSILKPQLFLNIMESGKNLLSFSKRRCPHMGCALKWNAVERTWDCPCHGSRFTEDGKVLDNPANGNR